MKGVPDLLETLMSEKRLLQAAILLVRSLKIINKPDMMEIGAVSDLRSYLVSQETVRCLTFISESFMMLSIRLSETFWQTNFRVISTSSPSGVNPAGQFINEVNIVVCSVCLNLFSFGSVTPYAYSSIVPLVEFEAELMDKQSTAPSASTTRPSSPRSPSFGLTRLTRFLNDLGTRANDPPHDINEIITTNTSGSQTASPLIPSVPAPTTIFINGTSTAQGFTGNPEADSFAYMETLLESLAVLGKLGSTLDNIAQRLPGEVFSLVETTINEVGERAEYTKRQNAGISSTADSIDVKSDSVYLLINLPPDTSAGEEYRDRRGRGTMKGKGVALAAAAAGGREAQVKSTSLRLTALENSARHMDHEIMKDLFWTLYSKLDAVAQGLRVVYEVANRIGSVCESVSIIR